jgi:hypothetical protein
MSKIKTGVGQQRLRVTYPFTLCGLVGNSIDAGVCKNPLAPGDRVRQLILKRSTAGHVMADEKSIQKSVVTCENHRPDLKVACVETR